MQLMRLLINKIQGLCNKLPLHDLSVTDFFGRTGITKIFLSEAVNVDITDLFGIRRRKGSEKKKVCVPHSLWSNGKICLYRHSGSLYQLNDDFTSTELWTGLTTEKLRMYYVENKNIIYCSDGQSHLVIDKGVCRVWNTQLDLRFLDASLRTRLLTDVILDPLPIGSPMEHYNSILYSAEGDVIWHSEPYIYELCDLANNYILEESPIKMLAAVEDGIWVSNSEEILFYRGDSPPFKRIKKIPYPAIKGTDFKIAGHYILNAKAKKVIVVATENGYCILDNGGEFNNVTDDVCSLPSSEEGASLFRQHRGINQFLVSYKNPEAAKNIYE